MFSQKNNTYYQDNNNYDQNKKLPKKQQIIPTDIKCSESRQKISNDCSKIQTYPSHQNSQQYNKIIQGWIQQANSSMQNKLNLFKKQLFIVENINLSNLNKQLLVTKQKYRVQFTNFQKQNCGEIVKSMECTLHNFQKQLIQSVDTEKQQLINNKSQLLIIYPKIKKSTKKKRSIFGLGNLYQKNPQIKTKIWKQSTPKQPSKINCLLAFFRLDTKYRKHPKSSTDHYSTEQEQICLLNSPTSLRT